MIQIQDVSKSFNDHTAIQNLNLTIGKGYILELLGANGAREICNRIEILKRLKTIISLETNIFLKHILITH